MSRIEDISNEVMSSISGNGTEKKKSYYIYNKIIAFRGVIDGVGCSTLVCEVAVELASRGLSVCIIDTSIMYPIQSKLLQIEETIGEQKDWLDLIMSDDTGRVLKYGKLSNNIALLSFENRTLNDLLSTFDNEELVICAYRMLEPLYDVILVDVCGETTNITASALIHSHTIYQVWSDEFGCICNIDKFLTNAQIGCCHLEKMRNVILNKNIINNASSIGSIAKKYDLEVIAEAPFSLEFYEKQCLGIPLCKMKSVDKNVNLISSCVSVVADKIMGIEKENPKIVSGIDIVSGKIKGTLMKKFADGDEMQDELVRNDMSGLQITMDLSNHHLFRRGNKRVKPSDKTKKVDEPSTKVVEDGDKSERIDIHEVESSKQLDNDKEKAKESTSEGVSEKSESVDSNMNDTKEGKKKKKLFNGRKKNNKGKGGN